MTSQDSKASQDNDSAYLNAALSDNNSESSYSKKTAWIQKYAPRDISELAMDRKKIREFQDILDAREGVKPKTQVLILLGPSGCGKNTLMSTYCKQNGIQLEQFDDITQGEHLYDVFGDKKQLNNEQLYPQDLENLIGFLRKNIVQRKPPKPMNQSSFCSSFQKQNSKPTETLTTNASPSDQQTSTKICLVQNLPECLKLPSMYRPKLQSDFNEAMIQLLNLSTVNNSAAPQIIFMFSNSTEICKSFLRRMFSQQVLDHPRLTQLSLNRPTNGNIDKVLRYICGREGIGEKQVSQRKLDEIRTQSGRDLRNSIQTLQFYSAGKTYIQNDKNENAFDKLLKKTQQPYQEGRDDTISLFHALGKFLYNKRINKQTKEIEQMTYKQMQNPITRPRQYFNPLEVMQGSMVSSNTFSLYLHQNMHGFFGDIEDLANCLDTYSQQDSTSASITFDECDQRFLHEHEELAGLVNGCAVLECNLHVQKAGGGAMYQMQVPQWFEHVRNARTARADLHDLARTPQLKQGALLSEDLLIRSYNESVTNILPFMVQMGLIKSDQTDLVSFKGISQQKEHKHIDQNTIVKDNFKAEAQLDENLHHQQLQKKKVKPINTKITFQLTNKSLLEKEIEPEPITQDKSETIETTPIQDYDKYQGSAIKDDLSEDALLDALEDMFEEDELNDLINDGSLEESIDDEVDNQTLSRYF